MKENFLFKDLANFVEENQTFCYMTGLAVFIFPLVIKIFNKVNNKNFSDNVEHELAAKSLLSLSNSSYISDNENTKEQEATFVLNSFKTIKSSKLKKSII